MKNVFFIGLLIIAMTACQNESSKINENSILFTELDPSDSGIDFANIITESDSMNYFEYTSIYTGGGVSVGDINNDGLNDLFFIGNQVKNRLYLNKGNLKFEDVTDKFQIGGDSRWYTGSTMADVNGDGLLDIYCSVAGNGKERRNQLYINVDGTRFRESGKEYGLNDSSNSMQATFLDYDHDGDLDMYLANYPVAHVSTDNFTYRQRINAPSDIDTDKLYRNDGGTFTNVTDEAGLRNYSFSFGVEAADLNNDGWQDLYISSDYAVPDYFFLNQKDGTFKEVVREATRHTAFYGMGIDIADINNDGNLDFFQADMDANNNRRAKANMASMNPKLFFETVFMGFHHQYMHNNFQINNGVEINGVPQFSNISRLTGTSSTDWTWGPILADFNNDGNKDLFVTNGTRREVNNRDFFKNEDNLNPNKYTHLEASKRIPSERIDNFIFENKGNLDFEKANEKWGISFKGFSNGTVYVDLDNDGDLEIITNNVDDPASVFVNKASSKSNFLNVKLKGDGKNTYGLGARVYAYVGEGMLMEELTLTRGFLSSVAPQLHFGLGSKKTIDSLKVVWPDGKVELKMNVASNSRLEFDYLNAKQVNRLNKVTKTLFVDETKSFIPVQHIENAFDDFDKQVLLPHKMSSFGPAIAVGDLNGDGLDDYYLGGSMENPARMFMQSSSGFKEKENTVFNDDMIYEDIDALIMDFDNDGDNDIYVVSGGNEFYITSANYQDRIYINDGKGNFKRDINALPSFISSGSRVLPIDFDKDGKQDLLVLGRHKPWNYPQPVDSYLFKNVSTSKQVKFIDVTSKNAKVLRKIGMATDASITDIDKDGWDDVILVGEWMPIKVLKNENGTLTDVSEKMGLNTDTTGWWWNVEQGDFDKDGDIDFIVGNNGLNYKYKANDKQTFDIYAADFDGNKQTDIVLSYYNDGKQYPVRGRECSSQQIPGIKSKFKNYESYSNATLADVYTDQALKNALHYQVKSFASIYMENKGGKFITHELPVMAQFSNITSIIVKDFDKDKNLDALIAGNLLVSEVETPRNDAGYGLLLKGNGKGKFTAVTAKKSGIYVTGDVKNIKTINVQNSKYIIAAKSNDYLQFIKWNN